MEKRLINVNLEGKNALVTGGAKGIGLAISKALAANKANVAINYNTSGDSANALAKELGAFGITANSVDPGVILTDMHRKVNTPQSLEHLKEATPLGYLGQPEDIAGTALFLASDSASYITGATIAVNGELRMD